MMTPFFIAWREGRVAEGLAVVAEPDEVGRAGPRPFQS